MENVDIHNGKRRVELAIKRIKKSDIHENSKRLLEEFSEYCIAEGLAFTSIDKHLFGLRNVATWAKKDLEKTDKRDMVRILGLLEKSHYSPEVKHGTKVTIKKFYKWLNGGEEYPEKVKWIRTSMNGKKRLPKELLSIEDVMNMINAADHIRDKALISLLYESGLRIGELLSLMIKNIYFDEYGAKILIPEGKTGMRKIRLVSSVPHLATWIENHPFKDNPESHLWVGIGTRNKNDLIGYQNARTLIKNLAKKANIKKRINPHLFRHSRATFIANHFTEAQMNHYFGWVQGSKMPSTYVHLSGRDIDGAVLKLHGLKEHEKIKEELLSPKKCHRCEKENPATGKFCLRCGAPLNLETALNVEEKRKDVDGVMTALLKDPEVLNLLASKMKQLNIQL